jgi:predicted acetyltransferase
MDTIGVRRVREDEFDAWSDTIDVGFFDPKRRGNGPRRRRWTDLDRCWGAFDGGRPIATLRGIDLELTVPGGALVPMDGISSATVAASHRRRGLLSRMMAAELHAAKDRGEPLAGLFAAEYPIYGRFGYGPAAETALWHLDARAARFTRELPGTVEVVDVEAAQAHAPEIYDRVRVLTPGTVNRRAGDWERDLDIVPPEGEPKRKDRMHALCRDEDGQAVGYVRYKFGEERWTNGRPDMAVEVMDLFATTVEYEARLWKFLADHDWVSHVRSSESTRRADELWRDLLVDRRAAWADDCLEGEWVRILDAAAALGARRYEVPGRIVLGIADKDGYADGTFVLEGGPDDAACKPTTQSPEVTVPVGVLGSIYLGGFSAERYRVLGLLDEHSVGAVARLSAMFHTAIAPWAATTY